MCRTGTTTLGTTTTLAHTIVETRLVALVADALAGDWLRLHYQPIVELDTGRVVGHEALLRIDHPLHGVITPDVFLSEVEGEDVMLDLGRWAIEEAIRRTGARWASGERTWVAVNVAAPQLAQGAVCDPLQQALERNGLPAAAVHIELTESSDLLASVGGRVELQRVADVGSPIWLDNFGTGYSSFGYLQHLQVAGLKIDRSFVSRLGADPRAAAIISAMLATADLIGLGVVAEGVERASEAAILQQLGCKLVQGYRFGRPLAESATSEPLVITLA